MSTDTVSFVHKGYHGSGWVAAYGSYILGLPVCALHSSSVQVPISNDYRNAKTVLDLSAGIKSYEFLTAGESSESITVKGLDGLSRL